MIKTEGFTIALPSSDHARPSACASCNGPRQTWVVLQTSKRSGNITTILRMKMPYCRTCGARVAGAGFRMMLLFSVVTVLSIYLPALPGLVNLGIASLLASIGGAVLALVLSVAAAFLLLPGKPAAPATARGEAVTVTHYDDAGRLTLFCTNPTWAQRFAQANHAQAVPSARYRLVEPIAVVWSLVLAVAMVVMVGYAAANPPAPTVTSPTVPTAATTPPPAKTPAKTPTVSTPAKKK